MTKNSDWKQEAIELATTTDMSWRQIANAVGVARSTTSDMLRKHFKGYTRPSELLSIPSEEEIGKYNGPKVFIFDIETAPLLANVWQCWKQNVGLNQIREDWYMLSWAGKWLGDEEVLYHDVRDCGLDDKTILEPLWKILDEADWVITHNGDRFDLPKVRARMLLQGLPPFSPVKSIDTCKAAKKAFGFTSNKLEYLSDKLAPEMKKSTHAKFPGFELWKECIEGNVEAWDEMCAYNIRDVDALEAVYLKLRPWIPQHPNFSLYVEDEGMSCNCCGAGNMELYHKKAYTSVSEFDLYRCSSCGTFKRTRKNNLTKEKRDSLLGNVV